MTSLVDIIKQLETWTGHDLDRTCFQIIARNLIFMIKIIIDWRLDLVSFGSELIGLLFAKTVASDFESYLHIQRWYLDIIG